MNNPNDPATHVSGTHLADLLGVPDDTRLADVVNPDSAVTIRNWLSTSIFHGNGDAVLGANPELLEIPAIPLSLVVGTPTGLRTPTNAEVRAFVAANPDSYDPDLECQAALLTADPNMCGGIRAAQARVCGVPMSIFNGLIPADQDKTRAGLVVPPPVAPRYVARWLARNLFYRRVRLPGMRRRVWVPTLVVLSDGWYEYTDAAGWKKRDDVRGRWMRARLAVILEKAWYVGTHKEQGQTVYESELKSFNPDDRNLPQVVNALADISTRSAGGMEFGARELADMYGVIHGFYRGGGIKLAVRNGVVDIATGTLLPRTPLWFDLTLINADYDPDAEIDGTEFMEKVVRMQWPDDPGSVLLLQMWIGYLLSRRTSLQKMMWIFGPPGSAKSIIAAVLEALIGGAISASLDTLTNSFGWQEAHEKNATLVLLSDVRHWSRETRKVLAMLLAVIGGDSSSVNAKFKAIVSTRLGVRFHGTSNEPPPISDHTGAMLDRLLLLKTTRSFKRGGGEDDPQLLERIIANELGAILRWGIEGLRLLEAANWKFAQPGDAVKMFSEIEESMSFVVQFLNDCAVRRPAVMSGGHRHNEDDCLCVNVGLDGAFQVFVKWSEENRNGEHMSKTAFKNAMERVPDGIKPGQLGNGVRVIWGIEKLETIWHHTDRDGHVVGRYASTDPVRDGAPASDDPFETGSA